MRFFLIDIAIRLVEETKMNKKKLSVLVIIGAVAVVGIVGYGLMMNPMNIFSSSTSTQTQQNSSNTVPSPPVNSTPPATPTGVTFDFDRGVPSLLEGENLPFYQTSSGITASFRSYPDPTAFSVQSYDSTFYKLSQFSGNYLYQNKAVKNTLEITFSRPITDISLTFATVEYHGVGNVDEPSLMKLTAYMNSTQTTLAGSTTAQGAFSSDLYPEGTLSFHGNGKVFNQITVELLTKNVSITEFFIDTIVVTTAPQ